MFGGQWSVSLDGLSWATGLSSTWSLILQQANTDLFPWGCKIPPLWAEAPKASWGFRTGPASSPLHSISQSKSPGQPSFKEQENRLNILMGEAAKSHCKGGVENYDHILNQSTTVFVVGSREECQSLRVRTGGRRGTGSGNHSSPLEMLVENSHGMKLIEKHSLHCMLLIWLWLSWWEDKSTFK